MADQKPPREYATIDEYDRQLGQLDGLPGALQTKPVIHQDVGFTGAANTYVVRTVRQQDRIPAAGEREVTTPPRFTVFLEVHGKDSNVRVVLPPRVADIIARQREALTDRSRKASARKGADERKARGFVPNTDGLRKARRRKKATK